MAATIFLEVLSWKARSRGKAIATDPLSVVVGEASAQPRVDAPLNSRVLRPHWQRSADARVGRTRASQLRAYLQRRGPANLRRHVRRAAIRFLVLAVADMSACGVVRGLVRVARDDGVFGPGIVEWARVWLPSSYLDGWQFGAALFVGLLVTGTYGPGDRRRDPFRLFSACALAAALPMWSTVWARGLYVVMPEYLLRVLLVWGFVLAERLGLEGFVRRARDPKRDSIATLLVGPASVCQAAAASTAFAPGSAYRALGFLDDQMPTAQGALGHISDFPHVLEASGAEAVVLCGHVSDPEFREVVDVTLVAGCQLLAFPRELEAIRVRPIVVWWAGQPLIELTTTTLRGQQLLVKRALDLIVSVVGLLVLSPILALIGFMVRIDSPGSVFFTQPRIGQGGRLFRILKFRTMVDGAEAGRDGLLPQSVYADPRLFKVPGDPRVTRLGRWLRRNSLDELPQLINVLTGEMSLVGPRPPLPSEVALYEEQHYARFDVKPGITGPWQVSGRNEITDFEAVVAIESKYIRNWSILEDLRILLRTIPTVLSRRGAQ